jgi:hypothetical protein
MRYKINRHKRESKLILKLLLLVLNVLLLPFTIFGFDTGITVTLLETHSLERFSNNVIRVGILHNWITDNYGSDPNIFIDLGIANWKVIWISCILIISKIPLKLINTKLHTKAMANPNKGSAFALLLF